MIIYGELKFNVKNLYTYFLKKSQKYGEPNNDFIIYFLSLRLYIKEYIL